MKNFNIQFIEKSDYLNLVSEEVNWKNQIQHLGNIKFKKNNHIGIWQKAYNLKKMKNSNV